MTGPRLIDAKVATRTRVQFQGRMSSGNGEFFLLAQQAVFGKRQKENPGAWSLAQLSTSPYFVDTQPTIAVEYELWSMLPVPQEDVPLNDILEFKAKRHAELVALRAHLDEVYELIVSSSDIPRSKNAQLSKLEVTLNEIDRTLGEYGIRKSLTSLRGFIAGEFVNIAGIGLGAAGIAPLISMSPLTAGLAGAGITFAVKVVLSPKAAKGTHPLTYVSSIKKDLST